MISTLEMRIVGLGKLNTQVKIKQLPSIEVDVSAGICFQTPIFLYHPICQFVIW